MKKLLMVLPVTAIMFCLFASQPYAAATARIGNKEYNSLLAAFADVQNGQTICVEKNVTLDQPLDLSRNIECTVDFNNHLFTNLRTPTHNGCAFKISKGKLTVKNAKIIAKDWLADVNNGRLILESGEYCSSCGINGGGGSTIKITGGKHVLASEATRDDAIIYSGGDVVITGGSFRNEAYTRSLIISSGNLLIEGGDFNCYAYSIVYGYDGIVIIRGGDFKTSRGEKNTAPVKTWHSEVIISGGSFQSSKGYSLDIHAGKALISGGVFRSIRNRLGRVTLTGAKLSEYILTSEDGKTFIFNATINQSKEVSSKPMLRADNGSEIYVRGGKFIS